VSPDGRFLSFVDWSSNGELALHDMRTGRDRRLTHDARANAANIRAEYAQTSTISRDGKHVAYAWWATDRAELRILDIDATRHPQRLMSFSDAGHWIAPFDWSPDGKWLIAMEGWDRNTHLVLVSTTDGTRRELKSTPNDLMLGKNTFSPDGRYVVYALKAGPDSNSDVFVMTLTNGAETPIATARADELPLGWTTDGKSLVFASSGTEGNRIWRQPLTAAVPQGPPIMIADRVHPDSLGMTRDGTIYFGVNTPSQDVYVAAVDFMDGRVLSPPKPLGPAHAEHSPAWSLTGRQLAFVSQGDSSASLVIRSMEDSTVEEFKPDLTTFALPIWSADGSILVTGSDQERRPGVFRVDLRSAAHATPLLIDDSSKPTLIAASDNGGTLYLQRSVDTIGTMAIAIRDTRTGREREIVRDVADFFAVSPDHRFVALTERRPDGASLLLAPTDGGPVRSLLHVGSPETLGFVTWMPDSTALIFMKLTQQPGVRVKRDLMRIASSGGQPRVIALGPDFSAMQGASLRIHPDGTQLAFNTLSVPKSEVWALDTKR
jgi:Tol biopolymer transport system component